MPLLIQCLWYAGIALKGLAAYRLMPRLDRFPGIWTWIVVSGFRSVLLVFIRNNVSLYHDVYSYSAPLVLMVEAFAVVEVFWLMTEHFVNFRSIGRGLLTSLAILGTVAAALTRMIGVPPGWKGLGETAILFERYSLGAMVVVLIGTAAVQGLFHYLPVARSSRRACYILTIHGLLLGAANAFTVASSGRWPRVSIASPVLVGTLTAGLLAFWLPAKDAIDEVRERALSPEEDEAQLERIRQGVCGMITPPDYERS